MTSDRALTFVPLSSSRREFLCRAGGGFATLGLIDLLSRDNFFAYADSPVPGTLRKRDFPTQAKHVVFLFMNGAPSQVDTFDPKPALEKYDGKPYMGKTKVGSNGRPIGNLMKMRSRLKNMGKADCRSAAFFPTHRSSRTTCVSSDRYSRTPLRMPAGVCK